MTPHRLAAIGLAIAALTGTAAAADGDTSFAFSGFATLGAAHSSSELAEFVTPGQPSGAQGGTEFSVDSKVGVQGTVKFGPQFSATAQLISKYNGRGNWNPEAEWLFAKWQAMPSLALRVGRMGLPAFAVSDFRDVNYANLWVRPPLDVYGQVPVSHFDGADVIWQGALGGTTVTAQVFGGKSTSTFEGTKIELGSLVGVNATADLGNGLTLRVGHLQTKLTVHSGSLPTLLGGLTMAGFGSIAEQIDPTKKDSSFSGLGLAYDEGDWVASAEYTMRRSKSYVADTTGWSATVGRRFGTLTPFLMAGQVKVDDGNIDNTIPVTTVPGLETLRLTVDGLVASQRIGQKTLGLGLRWDAWRNTAVKLQWERVRTGSSDHGFFRAVQPGFDGSTVLSLSVDVVF